MADEEAPGEGPTSPLAALAEGALAAGAQRAAHAALLRAFMAEHHMGVGDVLRAVALICDDAAGELRRHRAQGA